MPDTVDAVSDTNSNRQDLLDGTVHRDDFVSNGCEMSISGTDVSIASGIAHRTYSGTYYRAYVSRRKFTVPDGAVTAIHYDFSAGEIVADGSTPSEPYLQIGEADTTGGTSTVDDTVAREPTRYGQMGSDLNPSSVSPNKLSGWADKTVYTTSGLESAFNNLSQGDTVVIAQPETPYRTTQFLDIEVDGVTIIGESPYAENGEALIKPADGSDVGGIRVGVTTPVDHTRIRSVGFDGNPTNMDPTVKRLHGIAPVQGQDIEISGCYLTRTHPYHEHNSGGSGISVEDTFTDVGIYNNFIEDIGDRGIQFSSTRTAVYGNFQDQGYDRFISANYSQVQGSPNNGNSSSDKFAIVNNHGQGNVDGSIIGVDIEASGKGIVAFNTGMGEHKTLVRVKAADRVVVVGNVGEKTVSDDEHGLVIEDDVDNAFVGHNILIGYNRVALEIRGDGTRTMGNTVIDCVQAGLKFEGTDCMSLGDRIESVTESGRNGMQINGDDCVVSHPVVVAVPNNGVNLSGARGRVYAPTVRNFGASGVEVNADECYVDQFDLYGPGTSSGGNGVHVNGQANCYVGEGDVRNVQFETINVDSGSSGTIVENRTIPESRNGGFKQAGTLTLWNGVGEETANAETPTSANWPTGAVVDFTDSGDGSGTAVYRKLFDGTWVAIA